jgi:ABC-type nitrate/sulfonate/bicarbonate transport system permease component
MAAAQLHAVRFPVEPGIPEDPPESIWRGLYRRWFNVIWGALSLGLFFFAWELSMRQGWVDPFFLSSPSQILAQAQTYLSSPEFIEDASTTASEFLMGFGLSVVIGVPLGIAIGWNRLTHALLHPLLFAFYVVPHVAFLPLVIMWFGIGVPAKAVFVLFSGLFPILYNTEAAVHLLDPKLITAARSFKATDLQILRTVVLPGAVPVILSGVRLSVGKCLTAVVVAEFWASFVGLGNMIARAAAFYLIGKMFVGIIIIALLGIVLTELARLVERRFDSWRVSQVAER